MNINFFKNLNFRTETITLTPELAQHFLNNRYKKQRKIQIAKSEQMARDIKSGRWVNSFHSIEPIILTSKGELMNGQHRCLAVILAGMPIQIDVMYDVPEEMFSFIDGGTARTVKQFIDAKNSAVVGGLSRYALAIENGTDMVSAIGGRVAQKTVNGKQMSVHCSRSEVLDYYEKNREHLEWCANEGVRLYAGFGGGSKNAFADALWTVLYIDSGINKAYIESFVDSVVATMPTNPIIAYGKQLGTKKLIHQKSTKEKVRADWWLALVLTMWDARYSKKTRLGSPDIEKTLKKYKELILAKKER